MLVIPREKIHHEATKNTKKSRKKAKGYRKRAKESRTVTSVVIPAQARIHLEIRSRGDA
jgi:hypothetical protein